MGYVPFKLNYLVKCPLCWIWLLGNGMERKQPQIFIITNSNLICFRFWVSGTSTTWKTSIWTCSFLAFCLRFWVKSSHECNLSYGFHKDFLKWGFESGFWIHSVQIWYLHRSIYLHVVLYWCIGLLSILELLIIFY